MQDAIEQQDEKIQYLTGDEIALLLKAIAHPRDRAIVRVALDHGLRASEIGLLNIADYVPGQRSNPDRILIKRLKDSIGGETILGAESTVALRKWVRIRGRHAGPLVALLDDD